MFAGSNWNECGRSMLNPSPPPFLGRFFFISAATYIATGRCGPVFLGKSKSSLLPRPLVRQPPLLSPFLLKLHRSASELMDMYIGFQVDGYFADSYPHVFNDFFTSLMSNVTIRGFELRPCVDIFRSTTECTRNDAYSFNMVKCQFLNLQCLCD